MITAPAPRSFGAVNWRGLWTLLMRGFLRFFKLWLETLGGPLVSSLLFLAIFVVAAGGQGEIAPGLSLPQFIVPGIVILAVSSSAFQMAAFPLLDDKMEGMIGDLLAAPLSPAELVVGYALASAVTALMTGALVFLLTLIFVDLEIPAPALALVFAVEAALLFAVVGVLAGIWAERWEHYSMAESFLVLPLGFLSGTFFSLGSLPPFAQNLIALNPVFYAIDGFRLGLTGYGEAATATGLIVLTGLNLALWVLAWRLFAAGYKIKP